MKKNKKISIFKRIGLIALAFCVSIGSFFLGVQKNGHNQSLIASADYISESSKTFISSDIIYSRIANSSVTASNFNSLLADNATNPILTSDFEFMNWNFKLDYSTVFEPAFNDYVNTIGFYIKGENYSNNSYGYGTFNGSETLPSFVYLGGTISIVRNELKLYLADSIRVGSYSRNNWNLTSFVWGYFAPNDSSLPSLDMISIELCNYNDFSKLNIGSLPSDYNFSNIICYTDTSGWKYLFFIPTWYSSYVQPQSYLDYRKYYTSDSYNFSDNAIYNEGYQAGLADNQSNIYDNGYNAGKTAGFSNGYNQGIREANDYSFMSLFGAVIDAPIKAFSGLFNFEILGINLLDFFLGLLTFGVIIFVIKLLLGGK